MKEKERFNWNDYLSARNTIFGIAALYIMLYHINKYVGFNYLGIIGEMVSRVLHFGNSGVDVFLFLSALGLTFSNFKDGVGAFYVRRAKRILPVYFMIAIPFLLFMILYYINKQLLIIF